MARFVQQNPEPEINNSLLSYILIRHAVQQEPRLAPMTSSLNNARIYDIKSEIIIGMANSLRAAGVSEVFWDNPTLPFPNMWLGFDEDINVGNFSAVGILINSRDIYLIGQDPDPNQILWDPRILVKNGVVIGAGGKLFVAVVNMLIPSLAGVNIKVSRKNVEGSMSRKLRIYTGIASRDIPPAYYPIQILDQVAWSQQVKYASTVLKARSAPAYRHDVAGHYRFIVKTGPLSDLDPALIQDLIRRDYQISISPFYEFEEETAMYLDRNGIFRQEGEYLAVLKTRVTDYIKGPPDKPYVPGRRVLKNA